MIGRCERITGIVLCTALGDQVMTTEPYRSAQRMLWIVDNGASRRPYKLA